MMKKMEKNIKSPRILFNKEIKIKCEVNNNLWEFFCSNHY